MTVRLVADEHIARTLLVGLSRIVDDVDIVRVQDVGLRRFNDPTILAWAADAGRALVTQDICTMPEFAHERVAAGLPMPGIFVLPTMMPIGTAIDELAVIVEASDASELADRSSTSRSVDRLSRIRQVIRTSSEALGNGSMTFRQSWRSPMGYLLNNPRFSRGARELS